MVEFIKFKKHKEVPNFFKRLLSVIIGIFILIIMLTVGTVLVLLGIVFIIILMIIAPFVPKWWVSKNE